MRRWEVIAIVGILVLVFAAAAGGAYRGWKYPSPNSFGPDWRCIDNPYATVCIKDAPPAPAKRPP